MINDGPLRVEYIGQGISTEVKYKNNKLIIAPLNNVEKVSIYDSLYTLLQIDKKFTFENNIIINDDYINIKCECIFDLSKTTITKEIFFGKLYFLGIVNFDLPDELNISLEFYGCIFDKKFQFGHIGKKCIVKKDIILQVCEFVSIFCIYNTVFDRQVQFSNVKFGKSLKQNQSSLPEVNIVIENITFNSRLSFKGCKFYTITQFLEVKCFDNATFINSTFHKTLSLKKCEFIKTAEFTFVNFLDSLTFDYVIFHNNVIFTNALICYDISLMDVSFKDAQSVQMAGLFMAANFDTIKEKINKYSIENKQYNKVSISSIIQDSFRLIKDILITQHNILLASFWHRLELYANEILLDNELNIKKLKKDIQMLDKEEQIAHKKRLEGTRLSYFSKYATKIQLWFYRKTSDHHTDLSKIIQWIIVLVGYFALSLFLCKYGFDLKSFFDSHSNNQILSFIYSHSPNFIFCYKFVGIVSILCFLGFFYVYLRLFVGFVGICFLAITNPKYIFGVANLFNSNLHSNGIENIVLTLYTILAILLIFSLQKTARRNSIVPN